MEEGVTLLDHTADLGLEVTAGGCKELYRKAARALCRLVGRAGRPCRGDWRPVTVDGMDATDLLVNWLREVLAVFVVERKAVLDAAVDRVDDTELCGRLLVADARRCGFSYLREIKAVTYHGAFVREQGGLWRAQVVLDT